MDRVKFVEGRPYHFNFLKGCLPQVLLGPFLNTLTHLLIWSLCIRVIFSSCSSPVGGGLKDFGLGEGVKNVRTEGKEV